MTAAPVRLNGGGVAAAAARHLLAADGFDIEAAGAPSRAAPVVMLSAPALALLRDVFGQPGLFAGRPRIARRVVAWGGAVARVAHEAIVVRGVDLSFASPACGRGDSRGRRGGDIRRGAAGEGVTDQTERNTLTRAGPATEVASAPAAVSCLSRTRERGAIFTLHAAPPFADTAVQRFGARVASAAIADLAPDSDPHACHIEATPDGWLFLMPHGEGKAWLLAVGGAPDAMLAQSRLVAAQVTGLGPVAGRFETAPRLLESLAGDDWLALGTAAIAFDPICGDGTAQAVREGLLAAAVIAGVRDGGDRAALLGHYQSMLLAAMRRHLQISLNFYATGGTSPWWRAQAAALAAGHDWCTARLGTMPEPRFVLHGTRLLPRALAA